MQVNPLTLIVGIIGAPALGNTIGRAFITPKENIQGTAERDAEFRRLARNYAIYNGILAAGLGYAATRKGLSENWRSASLGGAISTGILATTLAAALVMGPTVEEPAKAGPGPGTGRLLLSPAKPVWVSTFIPMPAHAGYR